MITHCWWLGCSKLLLCFCCFVHHAADPDKAGGATANQLLYNTAHAQQVWQICLLNGLSLSLQTSPRSRRIARSPQLCGACRSQSDCEPAGVTSHLTPTRTTWPASQVWDAPCLKTLGNHGQPEVLLAQQDAKPAMGRTRRAWYSSEAPAPKLTGLCVSETLLSVRCQHRRMAEADEENRRCLQRTWPTQ